MPTLADTNKDDELTEQEFISLPEADYDEDTQNPNWQQKRSNEFKNVIDTNHDGRASRDELVVSVLLPLTNLTSSLNVYCIYYVKWI